MEDYVLYGLVALVGLLGPFLGWRFGRTRRSRMILPPRLSKPRYEVFTAQGECLYGPAYNLREAKNIRERARSKDVDAHLYVNGKDRN